MGRVGSSEERTIAVGRDRWRKAGEIGTEIGRRRDAQRQELAILIKGQLGLCKVVASLVVRSENPRRVRPSI
jgi:hypothetical protein